MHGQVALQFPKYRREVPVNPRQTAHNQTLIDEAAARHRQIALMHAEGKTMQEIGALVGLSKQRVSQIIKRARERELV